MSNATITFPMLGESFSFTGSSGFTLLGRNFYWYGVIIALGFMLALVYCLSHSKQFGITQDNLIDMLIFAVPSGIVGARLYYVIFNLPQYLSDPLSIFRIWEGGLAIYGGIIGSVTACIIFCRVKKIPAGAMLDLCGLGLLIGQAVGRWGNFFNREAYGAETEIFCRMGLTTPSGTIYVHPAFLYESLWNVLGFVLLHIFLKMGRRKYDGQLFLFYIGWYSLGRVFIEGLRTDSLYLFGSGLRVSQLLACAIALSVIGVLFFNRVYRCHEPDDLWLNRRPEPTASDSSPDTSGSEKSSETED